jgi:hypothetical protein
MNFRKHPNLMNVDLGKEKRKDIKKPTHIEMILNFIVSFNCGKGLQ